MIALLSSATTGSISCDSSNPCVGHGSEVHCVLRALDHEEIAFLSAAFRSEEMAAKADELLIRCEPWCADSPCATLNGDHTLECGTCTEPAICRPGAEGYDVAKQQRRRSWQLKGDKADQQSVAEGEASCSEAPTPGTTS